MALTSGVTRHLVEYLAGKQSFIGEQVVFSIRSSGEISSSERLTDQQLIDHFPQLFADLVEYFLTDADAQHGVAMLCSDTEKYLQPLAPRLPVTTKVSSLGMAEMQVVEIARTLARGAKIIGFDEPTS